MILELVAVGVAGVAFFTGTKVGKADAAKVKAAVVAALPKIEASVASVEAKAKADVLVVTTELKKLF